MEVDLVDDSDDDVKNYCVSGSMIEKSTICLCGIEE